MGGKKRERGRKESEKMTMVKQIQEQRNIKTWLSIHPCISVHLWFYLSCFYDLCTVNTYSMLPYFHPSKTIRKANVGTG